MMRGGSKCLENGCKYEEQVKEVCILCNFCNNDTKLGGSTINPDLVCKDKNNENIFIEIKSKLKSSDWGQMIIYPDKDNNWKSKGNNKISDNSKILIEELLKGVKIFNGKIPKFLLQKITHKEWKDIKQSTNDFNDCYFECTDNYIADYYKNKGCAYIQVKDYGLYHTGLDICDFNVLYLDLPCRLRIRTKIHHAMMKDGYMNASVTASLHPIYNKDFMKSDYSLDNINKIPLQLRKINN